MKKEVELQIIIKNPAEVERKLRKIGKFVETRKQIDKYFVPLQRDFFKKEPPIEYLRIRFEKGKNHLHEPRAEREAKCKDERSSSLNYSFLHFGKDGWLRATETRKACLDFLKKLNIKYEMRPQMGYPRMLYRKLEKKNDNKNFQE